MKGKNIVILTSIVFIAILVATMAFTADAVSELKVTMGAVYEIVEIKSSTKGQITDFIFLDDDGNRRTLSEYASGKYIFQNFWGTWCPPCRDEIPDIIKLQTENKDNLIMIGIAMERPNVENPKQHVSNYAKQQGINYINFVGPRAVINQLVSAYGGINAVPTTHLIDKEGKIVETIVGKRAKAEFQTSLDKMMK